MFLCFSALPYCERGFIGGSVVKNLPSHAGDTGDPVEEEMATHSGILAGEIPWTEELGGLQFIRKELDMTEHALTVQGEQLFRLSRSLGTHSHRVLPGWSMRVCIQIQQLYI